MPTLGRAASGQSKSLSAKPEDRLYRKEFKSAKRGPGHRGAFSPLTRRILYVNALALCILAAGLLYLDEYRDSLIAAETDALRVQGELFAAALGEGAVTTDSAAVQEFRSDVVSGMVRRLVETTKTRARVFAATGELIADSQDLLRSGRLVVIEDLPPPERESLLEVTLRFFYDAIALIVPDKENLPFYVDRSDVSLRDFPEAARALRGEATAALRQRPSGNLVISVGVPVQRYKKVLGVLVLTKGGGEIEQNLFSVRTTILQIFAGAFGITVLLSIYLASTIARPIKRLSAVAEAVRRQQGGRLDIPDLTGRGDEIGDLSGALKDMTEALWLRMDAIETFAADVAHEIKNPLTSLRSAVETAARVKDPEQQKRLMSIIMADVKRLDRLISDISDASRLDAELSRSEIEPVDIGRMLETLVDIHQSSSEETSPRMVLHLEDAQLVVPGMESRLVQVLRNLIGNAASFSPPGGTIELSARQSNGFVEVIVEDEGPGIPETKLSAIFDRFYSDRPEGEDFGSHSGLGLSISRQIVEAHGGTIHAENGRDEDGGVTGARFIIRLPRS
jgi:two-component system sensor histidine kinase ChvG